MEPIRSVLVAVDLSARSGLVLETALRVVESQEANFLLLHVIRDIAADVAFYDSTSDVGSLQGELESGADAQLTALRDEVAGPRKVAVEVRSGLPWAEIVAAAIREQSELVVMGAHFHDEGRNRVLADAVSKVTQLAPCPVLVVPTAEE